MILLSLLGSLSHSDTPKPGDSVKHVSIHKGATLKETLVAFGRPYSASEETSYADGTQYLQLIYVNDICSGGSCSVIVADGVVTKFIDVRPDYIQL